VAAAVHLGGEAVGVRHVGGDQPAEQLQRLDVAAVEVVSLGRVDLEHADRLALVDEGHAEHRARIDPPAGLAVDARILGGVVAAQDAAFSHAEPGEACCDLHPHA